MREYLEYKGSIVVRKNGVIVHEIHNLVVTTGKQFGVSRLISNTEFAVLSAIGIGAGTTAPAAGDTALGTSLAVQNFDTPATRVGNTITATATFGAGVGTGTVSEASLQNGTANGSLMFSRATFAGVPKGAGDTIAVTWTVQAP